MNIKDYVDRYKDDRFFQEVFVDSMYNLGLTVIDIGALAGEFSFAMHPFSEKIYAIESNKKNFDELAGNILDYGFDRVEAFNLAIYAENGEGYVRSDVRGGDKLVNKELSNSENVVTKTLFSFMEDQDIRHVDILKIDVEEAEDVIFRSDNIDSCLSRVDLVVGEHLANSHHVFERNGFSLVEGKSSNRVYRKNYGKH